ncbi:MAG TPA: hypothetical protein VGX68_12365 [Thermoanaerobaculia bacterium]|jgi:hypothetical protein|nr:hypothetical protein [Thermoanaerobaculia bacterium]
MPLIAHADEVPLQNADVIALVQAGLGAEIIVAKIEQAPRTAFDVSTEALVQLKKRGASDTVVAAMLKRSAAPTAAAGAASSSSTTSPVSIRCDAGTFPLVRIGGQYDNSMAKTITWRAGLSYTFPDIRASVRTHDLRPRVVIRSEGDPRGEFFVVKAKPEPEDNLRRVPIGAGVFGMKGANKPNPKVLVPWGEATEESPGSWLLTISQPLEQGEYGVFTSSPSGLDQIGYLYSFGVD